MILTATWRDDEHCEGLRTLTMEIDENANAYQVAENLRVLLLAMTFSQKTIDEIVPSQQGHA